MKKPFSIFGIISSHFFIILIVAQLVTLGAFAGGDSKKKDTNKNTNKQNKVIVSVVETSLELLRCGYCHSGLKDQLEGPSETGTVVCSECSAKTHYQCFKNNGEQCPSCNIGGKLNSNNGAQTVGCDDNKVLQKNIDKTTNYSSHSEYIKQLIDNLTEFDENLNLALGSNHGYLYETTALSLITNQMKIFKNAHKFIQENTSSLTKEDKQNLREFVKMFFKSYDKILSQTYSFDISAGFKSIFYGVGTASAFFSLAATSEIFRILFLGHPIPANISLDSLAGMSLSFAAVTVATYFMPKFLAYTNSDAHPGKHTNDYGNDYGEAFLRDLIAMGKSKVIKKVIAELKILGVNKPFMAFSEEFINLQFNGLCTGLLQPPGSLIN